MKFGIFKNKKPKAAVHRLPIDSEERVAGLPDDPTLGSGLQMRNPMNQWIVFKNGYKK